MVGGRDVAASALLYFRRQRCDHNPLGGLNRGLWDRYLRGRFCCCNNSNDQLDLHVKFLGLIILFLAVPAWANNVAEQGTVINNIGIATTAGGIISATGGTAPTLTAGCNGAGSGVTAGSTNNRGIITTQTAASTTCTITWSAAAAWPQAPFCIFYDANASITPKIYSTGACGTATCVVDYASVAVATPVGYLCM
jgi:hypothetical protein